MLERDEVREQVLAEARELLAQMAREGMSADEIERALKGRLNDTERDLVWLLARHEIDRGPAVKVHLDSDELLLPAS
jgi:hypothetical protein